MKPLLKAVKTSHTEGNNWRDELFHFLLNYRATLHTATNVAPADLMFRRSICTKLPQLNHLCLTHLLTTVILQTSRK